MASYQDIIEAAYAKSMKNQPNQIATEGDELLDVTHRALSGIFTVAARFAPTRFGQTSTVVYSSGWARPTDAINVFRVEKDDGTEVIVVPLDDQSAEPSKPCVYELGGTFYLASGGTGLATTDDLVFYYSPVPAAPAGLGDNLPTLWDENFNELLIYDVAMFLTYKDGREEEMAMLNQERNLWASRFLTHLELHTTALRGRFGDVGISRNRMEQALGSVLTPGREVLR